MDLTALYRKAGRALLGTLVVFALLVTTHLGEFWPFSIYPMFSQGGRPWSRALVRDVTTADTLIGWQPVTAAALPGKPYPLLPHGVDPIDLANYVAKTRTWDAAPVAGLRQMFHDQLADRRLLVLRADGRLDARDSVALTFTPYVLLTPDTTYLNARLPR